MLNPLRLETSPAQHIPLTELNESLRLLRRLSPSDGPVLSWYLRVDGPHAQWLERLDAQLRRVLEAHTHESGVEGAVRAATRFIHDATTESAQSIALFARGGDRPTCVGLQFKVPVTETLVVDALPHLYPLFELRDSYDRFLVVLLRAGGVQLLELQLGELRSPPLWSEEAADGSMRRRTLDRAVRALERGLASAASRFIIAGPDRLVSTLSELLPPLLQKRLVATIEAPRHTPTRALLSTGVGMFVRWEREESQRTVVRLTTLRQRHQALAGLSATAIALARRQVETLVLSKTFDGRGHMICATCGHVTAMNRAPVGGQCGGCGAATERGDARESLLLMAEDQGSEIELVDTSLMLDHLGGVGAILRYPSDDTDMRMAS